MIKRIDHLGIATRSVEKASRFYRLLGLPVENLEEVKEQMVRVLFVKTGDTNIELLEPTHEDSPIAHFLSNRGEGIHHIALEVDNLEQVLADLKSKDIRLIDSAPRVGAGGKKIAFIHPFSTGGILVELCEKGKQKP